MLHTLRNLESLTIRRCIVYGILTKSVAKCLVQLETLDITNCPMVEAIVMNEGTSDGDIINFSKLESLTLFDLPRLKSFYREKKDMHFSSTSSIPEDSAIPLIQSQPLFDEMVAFPSLEDLILINLKDTGSDIWGKYYYNDSDNNNNIVSSSFSSSFCKLKRLWVTNCNKLETVIPLGMLHSLRNLEYLQIRYCNGLRNVFQHSSIARDLIHLKELIVDDCEMMREIIGGEADEQETTAAIIVFPELTFLWLQRLPNLSRFWRYKVHFPNLEDIYIIICGEIDLETIELGRDDSTCQLRNLEIRCDKEIQLPYKWRLRLRNLEELILEHCWPHHLQSLCFQRLKELRVHNSGCSTLFTFSAFKSLQQLQELEISNSDLLEGIVEDVRSDEASDMDKKTVLVFQLKSVILKNLPNLRGFVRSASYECHMPALTTVEVENCGLSALFTCSVFGKLQQLKDLKVTDCRLLEGIVEDVRDDETSDTNDKIITLPQLSSVVIRDLPNLKSFCSSSNYAFSMPNLSDFYLFGCPQVENFTFLKTSTNLVSVHSEWHQGEKFPDLNDYIKQNRKRGSNLIDSAGESSYSNQELETVSERVEE